MRIVTWFSTILLVCFVCSALFVTATAADPPRSLGVYVLEQLEGRHMVSSTIAVDVTNTLQDDFDRVVAVDRVPLESNESVRILSDMTEGRKVLLTTIRTYLGGAVIQQPTLTFADDAIKFRDLTWHVDSDAVLKDAKAKKLTHVLVGSITGVVYESRSVRARGTRPLYSITVLANLRVMRVDNQGIVWSQSFNDTKAGTRPEVAFHSALADIAHEAAEHIHASLTGTK